MTSTGGRGDKSEDTPGPGEATGRGQASARTRAEVARRLRARRSEISEAIFARVSDQWFDRAGSEDPEYVAGLRAAGEAALDYILVGIERPGASLQPVPVAALEQARRAARVGVGLETVLRRYLAGYALLEGFAIQEAERVERVERDRIATVDDRIPPTQSTPRQESALRDLLPIVSTLVDRLVSAVSSAYNKEIARGAALAGEGGRGDEGGRPPGRREAGSDRAGTEAHGGPGGTRTALEGSQRERIVAAIVEVVAERGYARASVGLVVERARVSRRTFYELFPGGLDDGLMAVMDMALQRIGVLLAPRLEEGAWQDGVRAALAALLVFFDSEPALTRVCIVETLGAGQAVVEHREGVVRAFRTLIVTRIEREIPRVPPLVAESAVASIMGVIYARIVADEQQPLIKLLGPLMSTVVAPFAAGEEAIAEEERRSNELADEIQNGAPGWAQSAQAIQRDAGLGVSAGVSAALPAALANPTARRLRECVMYLAEQGARGLRPSNREIATAIGVSHKSQISKLLSQLQDDGLAVKSTVASGGPNAWRLTPRGEEAARAIAARAS
jgi:AcrR family transcriptional regulator